MSRVAEIDLAAYRRNLAVLARRVAPAMLMPVVKADAYGHGLLPVALEAVASGAPIIGVLDPVSAMTLRHNGIATRLFAWLFPADQDYGQLVHHRVELGVSHLDQLERVAEAGRGIVHLKVDTGLHRNGADAAEWPLLLARAAELVAEDRLEVAALWTHIGEASHVEDSAAIARFDAAIAQAASLGIRPPLLHLAASAAGFTRADARYGAVRIGAFTYGIAPGDGVAPSSLGLEPVMTVRAGVVAVHGGLADLDIGWADGIPADAAGLLSIAIAGVRCPIIDVSSARTTVRTEGPAPRIGALATLFGPGTDGEATLQEWADVLGTIGEELVTRLHPAVPRAFLGATHETPAP